MQVVLGSYVLDKSIPRWLSIEATSVVLYTNTSIRDMSQLKKGTGIMGLLSFAKAAPTDGTRESEMKLKIAPRPFANGGEISHISG